MKHYVLFRSNPFRDTRLIVKNLSCFFMDNGWGITNSGQNANLAVSIGGDGTFLDTVRTAPCADIIGINKGTLGYLTEVEENSAIDAMEKYIHGEYYIESRMMLECDFPRIAKYLKQPDISPALNDIVIAKRNSSVIDIEIFINNKPLTKYYADGIIISTPTGSTGYAFSCGAPIVDPTSEMIMITPIAPHTLMSRSICVSADVDIMVKVFPARDDDCCKISIDGQSEAMYTNHIVHIKKSPNTAKLVKFHNSMNFIDKVSAKFRCSC